MAENELRVQFFDLIFGAQEGWVCIATTDPRAPRSSFNQRFFRWPQDTSKISQFIEGSNRNKNVYFCVNLLAKADRRKEHVLPSNLLWADLDEANYEFVVPQPSIVLRTSDNPDRFQAIWRLKDPLEPLLAEQYNKRIAYAYQDSGADKSGWDLTQLLRVPYTTNFKYNNEPRIMLLRKSEELAPILIFEALPPLPESTIGNPLEAENMPDLVDLPQADNVIYKYGVELRKGAFFSLWQQEIGPDADWSENLWRLIHLCLEAGMEKEEVMAVCMASTSNKYFRDNRPISHLWRDIIKATLQQKRIVSIFDTHFTPLTMPQLVDLEPPIGYEDSFIYEYRMYAEEATDAIADFHDLSAFILLSAVTSNSLKLRTSYATVVPNLWGLILGDSTLSRKTTAINMVISMINDIDPEMIVATDGSVEGLFSGLEQRPSMTSIYYRDEVSGLFEQMNKRDYLAGMQESFAQLYDVPPILRRRLRKETITVQSPIFIFFGGGVKSRVFNTLNQDYILQGFLPRFLIVSGDQDMDRIRPTGPATNINMHKLAIIKNKVADMYQMYSKELVQVIGGQKVSMPPNINVHLTPEAWEFHAQKELLMAKTAHESHVKDLALPTFERLSRSMLKMSMLLSASRSEPLNGEITVTIDDVKLSAWYIQKWGQHSVEIILNAGRSATEKHIERVLAVISRFPGILRSQIGQHYGYRKGELDEILSTLEDRMLIRKEQQGRGHKYFIK